jgi:hypothetical protein
VLWGLASEALGKGRPSLSTSLLRPDGTNTIDNAEAADAMNSVYIDKVDKLRVPNAGKTPSDTLSWPPGKRTFTFTFVRAARIAKVIKALNATEALGRTASQ